MPQSGIFDRYREQETASEPSECRVSCSEADDDVPSAETPVPWPGDGTFAFACTPLFLQNTVAPVLTLEIVVAVGAVKVVFEVLAPLLDPQPVSARPTAAATIVPMIVFISLFIRHRTGRRRLDSVEPGPDCFGHLARVVGSTQHLDTTPR